jgi:hypothetical protein
VHVGDFMNFLVEHRAHDLPSQAFADIMDTLMWSLDEGQAAILQDVSLEWLTGDDEYKVSVAISRKEAFPADSREALVALMAEAAGRFPSVQAEASRWIDAWDAQHGRA